jgi:hypothetical protein
VRREIEFVSNPLSESIYLDGFQRGMACKQLEGQESSTAKSEKEGLEWDDV